MNEFYYYYFLVLRVCDKVSANVVRDADTFKYGASTKLRVKQNKASSRAGFLFVAFGLNLSHGLSSMNKSQNLTGGGTAIKNIV